MQSCFTLKADQEAIPIVAVMQDNLDAQLAALPSGQAQWAKSTGFLGTSGERCLIGDGEGHLRCVLVGMENEEDLAVFGALAAALPESNYTLDSHFPSARRRLATLMWGLGSYQFTPYKKLTPYTAKLVISEAEAKALTHRLTATYLVRDLINTPTEDMGPAELAEAVQKIGDEFKASVTQIVGDDLLKENYPAIHAVGRASDQHPRLIDLRWGNEQHPLITLVGKGVCFDSGGLNLKPTSGMRYMKKDMGGAAHCIGLAYLIMAEKLPVRLRMLIPAVENAVSGASYRPGDVIVTRKGTTVEITNTDAEGRVILADALAEASTENPELIIDFTTLTGAARIALGTDIGALFSPNDEIAHELIRLGEQEKDPLWALPMYRPYRDCLKSSVADMVNAATGGYGGAIVAAEFLREFVSPGIPWVHLDLMAYNPTSKPARPEGGEANGMRAVFEFLQARYGAARA